MEWLVEALGWAGSLVLVASLLQVSMLRLRTLNLTASVMLVAYSLAIETWPMVALNSVVAAINIVFIVRLKRGKQETDEVPGDVHADKSL